MSKKLQLSVPTPCHENWDAMTPVEKGKFCGSCQKQVVDFSNMSDRDIAQFFRKPSTGSVCGRFMTDQLDRDIEIPKKRIPWVKYLFQIALPALFLSKAAGQTPKMGKAVMPTEKDTIRVPATNELRTLGMVLPSCIKPVENKDTLLITKKEIKPVDHKVTIHGRVVDENGDPVPFANIETGKKGFMAMTDEKGAFSIPVSALDKDSSLHISSAGFEKADVQVKKEDAVDSELYISLKSNVVLPEVVLTSSGTIMGKITRGCTNAVKGQVVQKKDQKNTIKIIPESTGNEMNKITVYPNPVKAGTNVTIEWKQTEEGYYDLQLLTPSGQQAHKKEIWIDVEARLLNIDLPVLSAGSYFMVMTNKKSGKKFTEKIIIL